METRICIDTSIFIGYFRGRPIETAAFDKALTYPECYVTAVVTYELFLGVARRKTGVEEREALEDFVCIPFGRAEAEQAATLHAELIQLNADIGPKDVMFAATCIANDLVLLTTNTRHFRRVPQLQVIAADEFIATP
jgi:predicted nucleic acid-binding protein